MREKMTLLFPWLAVIASVFICEVCFSKEVYDAVRDWGKSNRCNGRNNYEYSCIGNSYEVQAVPIITNNEVIQLITVDAEMLQDDELIVGVLFGIYNRVNQGELRVELRQGNNHWNYQYSMDEFADMEMCHIVFPTERLQAGEAQLVFGTDASRDDNYIAVISAWNAGVNDRNKNDINNFRHGKESAIFGGMFVGENMQQTRLLMELYTK